MKDDIQYKKGLFEAFLYIASEPLRLKFFTKKINIDETEAKIIIDSLMDEYRQRNGGVIIVEVADGYQFATNPIYGPDLQKMFTMPAKGRLKKGELEVLAIIAYKQPIHIPAIDEIRGSGSRQYIGPLMQRGWIQMVKRLEMPGRPIAYGTTTEFLKAFGLNSIDDMPKLREVREMEFDPLFR